MLVSELTVEDWRFQQLFGVAWCEQQALVLAASRDVDLHLACDSISSGFRGGTWTSTRFSKRRTAFRKPAWFAAREWLTDKLQDVAREQATIFYGQLATRCTQRQSSRSSRTVGARHPPRPDQRHRARPRKAASLGGRPYKDAGVPGIGFWNIAKELGIDVGRSDLERESFWLESLRECHVHWRDRAMRS
jgi:hypothetical protein